jgi:hypothetical protein
MRFALKDKGNTIIADVGEIEDTWIDGTAIRIKMNNGHIGCFYYNDNRLKLQINDNLQLYVRQNRERKNPYLLPDDSPKKGSKMQELLGDFKGFIKEHKSLLYWVAIAVLADHFLFNGAFREKLKGLMGNLVGKLEKKVEGV